MAVTFNEHSFIIEVGTKNNPVEEWLCLKTELLCILETLDSDAATPIWRTMRLIQEMMPELDIAQMMFPLKKVS